MDILNLIWLASWFLAAAAIIWMTLLIAARVFRDFAVRRRDRRYAAIMGAYMRLMRAEQGGFDDLRPYRREVQLLAEALLEVLDVVRGADRQLLIECLKAFKLDALLRRQVRRGRPASRLAIVEALAAFRGPETEKTLRAIGRREGPEVRMAAVKSLLTIGARLDIASLVRNMDNNNDPWSGSMADAMRLLVERQPDDCAEILSRRDLPAPVRAMVAEAMGSSGDYKLLPILSEAAMTDVPTVRAAALTALGGLMHPVIEPVVARGMRDEDWHVRGAAAGAAGRGGLVSLIPRLIEQLSDPIWWVRFQGSEALLRLGPQGIEALRAQAGLATDAARVASLALAERGL